MKKALLITIIIYICFAVSDITTVASAAEENVVMGIDSMEVCEDVTEQTSEEVCEDETEPASEEVHEDICEDVCEIVTEPASDVPASEMPENGEVLSADPVEVDDADLFYDEMENDCSDLSSDADEIVIEVNSDAMPSADFISANETIQSEVGSYDLIMYGLKEENKDDVINALEEYYDPDSSQVLKLVDTAIADAEKYDNEPEELWNTYDSKQCWAASAANMLWMAGWADELTNPLTNEQFTSEDDVFVFFNENFTDSGAEVSAGIDWFFTGEFYNFGYSGAKAGLRDPKDPEDGLMKEFASMLVQERYDLIENPGDIAKLADCDWTSETPAVFQASIGELFEGRITRSSHSVTVSGIIMDAFAEAMQDAYKSILIINSDNDATPSEAAAAITDPSKEQKNEDKAARPNSVSVYNLAYIQDVEGTPCWQLLGYGSNEPQILYAINRLPLYSRELVEQYTEKEGTKNIVDNVDLKFGTAFTTGETERIIDMFGKDEAELTKTEFQQGDPVNVNYFIANMGSTVLNETYTDGRPLTVDWKVVRDADNEVVAQGRDSCELPVYYGVELGYMSYLNQSDGELQIWKPGTYTLYLDLNTDRNVEEAYYLNNLQKAISLTILGEEEPAEEDPEEPDDPEEEPAEDDPEEPDAPEEEPAEDDPEQPDVPEEEPAEEDPGESDVPEEDPAKEDPEQPDDPEESNAPEEKPSEDDPEESNAPEEEPAEDTPEEPEEVPDSNSTGHADVPKTGDEEQPLLWLMLAFFAAMAGVSGACILSADVRNRHRHPDE